MDNFQMSTFINVRRLPKRPAHLIPRGLVQADLRAPLMLPVIVSIVYFACNCVIQHT